MKRPGENFVGITIPSYGENAARFFNFDLDDFRNMQKATHATAVSKGWWDEPRETGACVALMHSELSEALEAAREGNPPDHHCPEHSSLAIELADTIIRIMDFAEHEELDLASAIAAKMKFNATRPHKHGKEF